MPQVNNGTDGSELAMQGVMMKKKASTPRILRPITLEWVTRHFFLYNDGKMIYSRDGASVKPEEIVLLCNHISACQIDRAKASDLGKKKHHVANSFYITVPLDDNSEFAKTHKRTLLVAHGPEAFKHWIAAFRSLNATVNIEDEEQAAVPQAAASPEKAAFIPKEVSSEHSLEVSALRMSDAKFKDSVSSSDVKVKDSASTVPSISSAKVPDADGEQKQHVHFSSKEDEIVVLPETETENEKPGVMRKKSVSFDESSMNELIPDVEMDIDEKDGAADPAARGRKPSGVSFSSENNEVINKESVVSFSSADNEEVVPQLERKPSVVSFSSEKNEVINKENVVSFSSAKNEEVVPQLERKPSVSFSSEKNEVINKESVVSFSSNNDEVIEKVAVPALERQPSGVSFSSEKNEVINEEAIPALEKKPSVRFDAKPCDVIDLPQINTETTEEVLPAADATTTTEEQSEEKEDKEEIHISDPDEGVLYPTGCKGAKVFAYGDTLNELTKALTSKAVLYGVVATSLEETMDDETYANASPQQNISEMKAFSIEFLGKNADYIEAERFEQHLSEIISFCKSSSNVNNLHPIRCGDGEKAKDEIISVLEVMEDVTEEETEAPASPSKVAPNFYVNSSGLTAYKNALQTEDPADIPTGAQVLACVRDQKGVPYNWVLFQPSNTELVVEDAGSGGVAEMTQVLHEQYNDCVLFGLARVSFMGETFGQRQIWFGLEWSGENCTSVKMIRKLRDCATKMTENIGERSFTMTNISAADMTPDAVCAWVKRSCDVTDFELSVDSMNAAYTEEQKTIKEYYEKLAKKEEAKRIAREAKRKEQLRKERLWLRQETRENMAPLREERRKKWSKMTVPDILKDLGGNESISGWVLLEIDI